MTSGPFHRFLGVDPDADPRELLGLTSQACTVADIEAALRRRLSAVYRHPDGRTDDAAAVCRALRAAAAALRDPTRRAEAAGPRSAAVGPSGRRPRHRQMTLTPFDRHVLAVLVAGGGWNAQSRDRLVAIAGAYGVTVQGLVKVMSGLSDYAKSGGARIGVREITSGAARIERVPAPVPAVAAPAADRPSEAEPDAAERSGLRTVQLSILFGLLTVIACVLALKSLFRLEPPESTDPEAVTSVIVPEDLATGLRARGDAPPPPTDPAPPAVRPLAFDAAPTFKGPPLPDGVRRAAERCLGLPGELDEIARKLEITHDPSEAVFRLWETLTGEIAVAWTMVDGATRRDIDGAIDDALHAARTAAISDRLLDGLLPSTRRTDDGLSLLRGCWRAGTLGRISADPTLPPVVTSRARALLETALDVPLAGRTIDFELAVVTWLEGAVPGLVEVMEYGPAVYEVWERWLAALRAGVADDGRRDMAVLRAIERLVRTGTDLSRPGPSANVLGRLIATADFAAGEVAVPYTVRLFDDPRVTEHDLWVLSSLLAGLDAAPWFGADLVLPADADPQMRRRIRDRIDRRWSELAARRSPRTPAGGRGVPVDPRTARRWSDLLEASLAGEPDRRPGPGMDQLVVATLLNETAALLAARRAGRADELMDAIEALTDPASAAGGARGPAGPGAIIGRSGGTGASRMGQTIGPDGEWAAAYEVVGRDAEERLRLIQNLAGTAGTDLGPVDAELLVREAYRGGPMTVRAAAQELVRDRFSRGPAVAMELMDQFPLASRSDQTSEFVGRVTGRVLPPPRSASWGLEARLGLVRHALDLRPAPGGVDDDADLVAESCARRLAVLEHADDPIAAPRSPQEAIERLTEGWRRRASTLVVAAPVPDDLEGLQRRHATRLRLVEGPVQRFVAWQLALLDLAAYVTVAEQPARRDEALEILDRSRARRSGCEHVLLQAIETERALARIWRLRMSPAGIRADATGSAFPAGGGWPGAVIWSAVGRAEATDEAWSARLEALDPARPTSYFELGEEIADVAADETDRALARRLFGLAGALDPRRLGRSACLALAHLEEREHARRRLVALGWLLHERGMEPGWQPVSSDEAAPATVLAVTEALSHYRSGRGTRALSVLGEAGAMSLLEAHQGLLRGGMTRFLEDCKLYRSRLRPTLSEEQLVQMLHLELALLAGEDRSWASDLRVHGGRPLIEVDPNRLEEALGVDASRPVYRDGHWIRSAGDEPRRDVRVNPPASAGAGASVPRDPADRTAGSCS